MQAKRRVAVLVEASFGYAEGVMRGIVQYAATRPEWVTMWQDQRMELFEKVHAWRPDGIIVNLDSKPQAEAAMGLGVPMVSISGILQVDGVPRVSVENDAVAAMALDYFWSLGFRNFGCLSTTRVWHHKLRARGFAQLVAQRGASCASFSNWYHSPFALASASQDPYPQLCAWLRGLPKPVAIFGVEDTIALAAIEAAHECGIRVPDDIAVLGANNSQVLCMLANPNLSSLVLPLEGIGLVAAKTLNRLMSGEVVPMDAQLLPPVRVVERRSTDVMSVTDQEVAAAIRFIRLNAHRHINVSDVLKEVAISRRVLEQRFRRATGQTPFGAIHRAQVARAMSLLADTDLPMPDVARSSGFSSGAHLSTVFRACAATTPTQYRRKARYGLESSREQSSPSARTRK